MNSNYNGNLFSKDVVLDKSFLKKSFPGIKIFIYSAFHQLKNSFIGAGVDNFYVMGEYNFCLMNI